MQGRRGGSDSFFDFGDPFGGFGGFGSFGPPRSMLSNFFGGRNPFDDPFFTRPLGDMFESSLFGPSVSPFSNMYPSGFLEHQAPERSKSGGPIIEELDSDNEKEDAAEEKKENPRKHGRSKNEPHIEDPDDEAEEKKSKQLQHTNEFSRFDETRSQPQARSFCFQSSTVTYGGANGTYYTSSKTRSNGSDGVAFEECKEANSNTGQATHRVSRGLHNKGHSLTRKLNSDGKVDTMQTLHNLNEDELPGFEETWTGVLELATGQGINWESRKLTSMRAGSGGSGRAEHANQGGWALPSTQHSHRMVTMPDIRDQPGSSRTEQRAKTHIRDRSSYHPRGKGRN
ncbi:hypothetical protein L6164_028133 [Bauhinia variegata]|uniref:Uncharacterized protein n=1 Tax=Bauhinia variegata TaxID=167791 RepID=A0ACB9LVH7_BAUVA|nr:hypothetical protein L6164_028133 [Bauhinia variegata]